MRGNQLIASSRYLRSGSLALTLSLSLSLLSGSIESCAAKFRTCVCVLFLSLGVFFLFCVVHEQHFLFENRILLIQCQLFRSTKTRDGFKRYRFSKGFLKAKNEHFDSLPCITPSFVSHSSWELRWPHKMKFRFCVCAQNSVGYIFLPPLTFSHFLP